MEVRCVHTRNHKSRGGRGTSICICAVSVCICMYLHCMYISVCLGVGSICICITTVSISLYMYLSIAMYMYLSESVSVSVSVNQVFVCVFGLYPNLSLNILHYSVVLFGGGGVSCVLSSAECRTVQQQYHAAKGVT